MYKEGGSYSVSFTGREDEKAAAAGKTYKSLLRKIMLDFY